MSCGTRAAGVVSRFATGACSGRGSAPLGSLIVRFGEESFEVMVRFQEGEIASPDEGRPVAPTVGRFEDDPDRSGERVTHGRSATTPTPGCRPQFAEPPREVSVGP